MGQPVLAPSLGSDGEVPAENTVTLVLQLPLTCGPFGFPRGQEIAQLVYSQHLRTKMRPTTKTRAPLLKRVASSL